MTEAKQGEKEQRMMQTGTEPLQGCSTLKSHKDFIQLANASSNQIWVFESPLKNIKNQIFQFYMESTTSFFPLLDCQFPFSPLG